MKITKKVNIILSLLCFSFILCLSSCDDGSDTDEMTTEETGGDEKEEEEETPVVVEPVCPAGQDIVFQETDSIVVIEAENVKTLAAGWKLNTSLSGFAGTGYIEWISSDQFSSPGKGIITYKVDIAHAGTYQFIWNSRITAGNSNTEANDTWLRIRNVGDFFARKDDGSIVYPHGSGKAPTPAGAGSNGWFKIYMNHLGSWHWNSRTSDHDPHNIFVKFDTPGQYTIELSGRSRHHAIDRIVLFMEGIPRSTAINLGRQESTNSCQTQ